MLEVSRRRRIPVPWAAAAALLLAATAFLAFRTPETQKPPALSQATAPVALPDADRFLLAGRATAVTLRSGSRAEVIGTALKLMDGSAWVEDPGEPVEIRIPGGSISVTKGILLVEIPKTEAAVWLRAACADEGGIRLLVVSGSALLIPDGGEPVAVTAGQEASLGASGVDGPRAAASPAWRGDGGWQRFQPMPMQWRDGVKVLAPGAEAYVWEAVLRRSTPTATAGLRFRAAGRCWEMPLGAPLAQAEGWLRVRVEVRGGLARIRAGSYEMLREPLATLERKLDAVGGEPGLRVWGGDVEVSEARWKEAR